MVKRCLSADSRVCDRLSGVPSKRPFLAPLVLIAVSIFMLFALTGCLGGGGGGGGNEKVATPTFSPAPGAYTTSQSVSISCATLDATIRYTIDGTVPTELSNLYEGPIAINVTTTLKAIAYKSGMDPSDMQSGTYSIIAPTVATPTFDPPAGTYTTPLSVNIDCATPDATIYFTLDGSNPTTTSAIYTDPILVDYDTTVTIKAMGVRSGYTTSNVASGTFTVGPSVSDTVATPTFNPPAGTYTSAQTVTVSCATSGAAIYFTIDGSDPTVDSALVNGPITVGYTVTIKAFAVKSGLNDSNIAEATYTIDAVVTPPDVDHVGTYALRGFTIYDGVNTVTEADFSSFSGTFVLGETQLKQIMELSGVLKESFEQNYSWVATSATLGHIDTFTPTLGAYSLYFEISGNMLTVTYDDGVYTETDSWEKISDSMPPNLTLNRNGITDGLRGSVGLMQY